MDWTQWRQIQNLTGLWLGWGRKCDREIPVFHFVMVGFVHTLFFLRIFCCVPFICRHDARAWQRESVNGYRRAGWYCCVPAAFDFPSFPSFHYFLWAIWAFQPFQTDSHILIRPMDHRVILKLVTPWVKLTKSKRQNTPKRGDDEQFRLLLKARWQKGGPEDGKPERETASCSDPVSLPLSSVPLHHSVNRTEQNRQAGRVLVICALLGWYMTRSVEDTFQWCCCLWTRVFVREAQDEMWQDGLSHFAMTPAWTCLPARHLKLNPCSTDWGMGWVYRCYCMWSIACLMAWRQSVYLYNQAGLKKAAPWVTQWIVNSTAHGSSHLY